MAHTGSINYNVGEMPQAIKWIYTLMLKHKGFVTSRSEKIELIPYAPGRRIVTEFEIRAINGAKLTFTFDNISGFINCNMNVERPYTPIYEIGRSSPIEYVPGRVLGYDWEDV